MYPKCDREGRSSRQDSATRVPRTDCPRRKRQQQWVPDYRLALPREPQHLLTYRDVELRYPNLKAAEATLYVREIHINTYRHLENVHLGPFTTPPLASDLIVLAGPNGGGKSSVLELVGYALSNAWSLGWGLRRTFSANSFEIAIALAAEEQALISEHLTSAPQSDHAAVSDYLNSHGAYYRSFNYSGGEYSKNPSLHNSIHAVVTAALRNRYKRALGFFLKSDRYYPPEGFDRNRLFEWARYSSLDYIWGLAFNTSDLQYRDMFDYLLQQRYHYFRQLGAYHHALQSGKLSPSTPPQDPLKVYNDLLSSLFPGYSFADTVEDIPTNLFVTLPSGDTIPFQDLSSGEKEVFFILAFFLRHHVTNAIIVIDEPELHLHPEFARLLVRTMQSVKPGNQIWLGTHNPEIIDEAGRDRVVYLARDPTTQKSRVTLGTDEPRALLELRNFFGYSGYIGIGKKLVFLEGRDASADRKVLSRILPDVTRALRFVPSQSSENLPRLNAAILAIIESGLGTIDFYLVRDRDYLTEEMVRKYVAHTSGRLFVLTRHQIENYLLDEESIANVQSEIFGKPVSPAQVRDVLRRLSRNLLGEVLRDMVSFRINLAYRPHDFSMGKLFQGEDVLDDEDHWIEEQIATLRTHVRSKAAEVNSGLVNASAPDRLEAVVEECQRELETVLADDSWRVRMPGKRLLQEYCRRMDLGDPIVLQNNLIKELSAHSERVPQDLRTLLERIAYSDWPPRAPIAQDVEGA